MCPQPGPGNGVLPPVSPSAPPGPDLMVRLHGLADGIGRSATGQWPGPGPQDQRLVEFAHNLSRARDLVERCGHDVLPTSAAARADIAAARAQVMHTLYVGAHGTAVALREYATDLRSRLRVDTRRRRPLELRPTVREIQAAEVMLSRFEVFEQLVAGFVAAHPVAASALGEVRQIPRPSRLQSALTAWDIQVHRTLAKDPDAADLVRIGRVQGAHRERGRSSYRSGPERGPKSTPTWLSAWRVRWMPPRSPGADWPNDGAS
jgi:hypothetical protein